LAEPQRPADVRTLQAQFAEKLGARQIVSGKDIQPENLPARIWPRMSAALPASRTPNVSITMATMARSLASPQNSAHVISGHVMAQSSEFCDSHSQQ
jgi:hypothetical protein